MRWVFILLTLVTGSAQAAHIAVDRARSEVRITGTLDWSNLQNGLGLSRDETAYEVLLPLAGTPFEPGFTPPTAGSPVQPLAGAAQVVVGNPKRAAGELGATVAAGVFAGTSPRPSLIADQGIALAEVVRTFTVSGNRFGGRGREGDYAYNLFVNMDPAYARVTSIAAILRVRTPVVGTDTFTEEYFAGLDTQVVPLPGAAVLLASGLAGMAVLQRRQRTAG